MQTGLFRFLFAEGIGPYWQAVQLVLTFSGFAIGFVLLVVEFITTDPIDVALLATGGTAFVFAEAVSDYVLWRHEVVRGDVQRAASSEEAACTLREHYDNRWFDRALDGIFYGWTLAVLCITVFTFRALGA
jgi:hypothetical protein